MSEPTADTYKERYAQGLPILQALFALPAAELKRRLKEFLTGIAAPEARYKMLDEKGAVVEKTSHDDVPVKISINWYDCLKITAFGISYEPEHGGGKGLTGFDDRYRKVLYAFFGDLLTKNPDLQSDQKD